MKASPHAPVKGNFGEFLLRIPKKLCLGKRIGFYADSAPGCALVLSALCVRVTVISKINLTTIPHQRKLSPCGSNGYISDEKNRIQLSKQRALFARHPYAEAGYCHGAGSAGAVDDCRRYGASGAV